MLVKNKKTVIFLQNTLMHYRKPLYNGLAKEFTIVVVHSGGSNVGAEDKFSEVVLPLKRIGPFFNQTGLGDTIREHNPDVVVGMFDLRWPSILKYILKDNNFRYITWGHRYSRSFVANWFRNVLLRRAVGNVLYGTEELDRILANGVSAHKIFVAPNTIEVSNAQNLSQAKKTSFLYVGRAQGRKRIGELIRAFAQIIDEIAADVTVDIVGEGEENKTLMALAEKLGISNRVVFHGRIVDEEKLLPLFRKAFAYVSPGDVGLGVLHSLAYGVPVVTQREGRHGPEFHNLDNGGNSIIYQDGSELKNILLDFALDVTKSKRLGENAYQYYANKRSLTLMIQGFSNAIENRQE